MASRPLYFFLTSPQSFPSKPIDLLDQNTRMKAMDAARAEMVKLIAKSRMNRALRINVPRAVDKYIRVGMNVLFYR